MKKFYKKCSLFEINNEKYIINSSNKWSYKEGANIDYINFNTWEALYNYAKNQNSFYITLGETIFRKRKYVYLWADEANSFKKIYKNTFKPFIYYSNFEEEIKVEEYYSLSEISKKLSAKDFMEYLKDKGITTCPMIK